MKEVAKGLLWCLLLGKGNKAAWVSFVDTSIAWPTRVEMQFKELATLKLCEPSSLIHYLMIYDFAIEKMSRDGICTQDAAISYNHLFMAGTTSLNSKMRLLEMVLNSVAQGYHRGPHDDVRPKNALRG